MIHYALPATAALERRERRQRRWARLRALALLTLFLLWVAWFLPVPRGRWYVGHRQQWIVAIDEAGLTIGPTDRAVAIGLVPLVTLELLLLCVPIWFFRRLWVRQRGGRRAAR